MIDLLHGFRTVEVEETRIQRSGDKVSKSKSRWQVVGMALRAQPPAFSGVTWGIAGDNDTI
jgi:hypothetical protein